MLLVGKKLTLWLKFETLGSQVWK